MKLILLSAIAASRLSRLSASPTLAQSTPAEVADLETAKPPHKDARAIVIREQKRRQDLCRNNHGIAPVVAAPAVARGRPYDSMIAIHAASNGIPAELVHRVVVRESRYRAERDGPWRRQRADADQARDRARMGYSGSAAGLLDPETNLTYGVRYLAGAYRARAAITVARSATMRAAIAAHEAGERLREGAAAGRVRDRGQRGACGGGARGAAQKATLGAKPPYSRRRSPDENPGLELSEPADVSPGLCHSRCDASTSLRTAA